MGAVQQRIHEEPMSDEAQPSGNAAEEMASVSAFRINAHEWWVAHSLDEALAAAASMHGVPEAEVVDELCPPYRLSEHELNTTLINQGGLTLPLTIVLSQMVRDGVKLPALFATTT